MIAVTFTDGSKASYRIGCKRLGFRSWHHMDYRPMFQPIADIIKVDVSTIESWRVM